MSTLQNQLATQERDDVGRAVRGLLRTPWVTVAAQPALFDVVRRRQQAVGTWFDFYLGWDLHVRSDQGYVRLVKRPGAAPEPGDVRPMRRRRAAAAPFDRLRYVLLCVAAAEALDLRMVTIGELADRTVRACTVDDVLPNFQTDRQDHRRAFVDALALLEDLGVLTSVDGQTLGYTTDASAAVLYRVSAQAVHHLLATDQGPSLASPVEVAHLDAALAAAGTETGYGPAYRESADEPLEPATDRPSATQRSHWARHSFLRRLFDDAVVHREDLTLAQQAYLASITGMRIVREAAELAGFALEERAEGYLLVDPDRSTGPEVFPGDGAASAVGLHVLTHLLRRRDAAVGVDDLVAHVQQLMDDAPAWARTYRDEGGAARLLDESLDLLRGHQLVRVTDDGVAARPVAARYRAARLTRARPARRAAGADAAAAGVQDSLGIDVQQEDE
jgi:uncharacterized protein (TIGR02678 family)